MEGQGIDEELHRDLAAIADSVECELLHVRFANNQLQIFLDRPDGAVTIEHCQAVSRQVSALLDVHDFGQKRYVLEVSSPGLDRELFGPRDYVRFQGNLARVTFTNSEQLKQTVVGRLEDFLPEADGSTEDDTGAEEAAAPEPEAIGEALVPNHGLLIVQEDSPQATTHRIPSRAINKARLEIEI